MKIWFAANIPSSSQGGVARNMMGFGLELSRHGHEVSTVFASRPILRQYLLFMLFLASKLLRIASANRPDIIIARSTDGLASALLVRLLGLKTLVVLHNHGWEERVYSISKEHRRPTEPSLFTWRSRLVRFPLLRLTLALCHGCLCGTIDEIRWLRCRFPHYGIKLFYAPNGVDTEPGAGVRKSFTPLFLCVGAAGWRKNIGYTLELFAKIRARLPDSRLLLVGTGSARVEGILPPGLESDSVESIAQASMDQMPDIYTRAPFLITTSWYEGGHALVVLEAMAWGCVVFARAIPSVAEIVHDRENGMLLSGADAAADADTIAATLNDPAGLAQMGVRAQTSARRNRWERQGLRLNRSLSLMAKTNERSL
jgi:glycosyltransferase involved in cell wall biosynthesis